MHPTAIWAMRPYCVDARPLVATKKKKNNVSTFRQIGEKLKTLSYLEE